MSAKNAWLKASKAIATRAAAQKTVISAIVNVFKAVKKLPDELALDILANNHTHFGDEEIKRLLAAFKRVTTDRMQSNQFDEIIRVELGWSSPVLRKQLFRAFDKESRNELDFTQFVDGYSAMLRGTVPELLDFAWRLFHVASPPEHLTLSDLYAVLRLGLAGLEELRRKQGEAAGGTSEITFSPERTARLLIESMVGDSQAALTRREFAQIVLRNRRLVDCMIPGFVAVPQDPLHRAAELGDAKHAQRLISRDKFDVDGRDGRAFPSTPLHAACQYGHAEVVVVLLEHEASTRMSNAAGELALDVAIRHGRNDVVELLLRRGVEPLALNALGQCAVHTAALHGNYAAAQLLMPHLHQQTVMDLRDKTGATPLHLCARADQWNVVNVFLQSSKLPLAELNATDHAGMTAMHVAAGHRATRVARKLAELGANCSAEDADGRHVLHHAVRVADNDSILRLLLEERGCDVEAEDNDGRTALHLCIRTADASALRLLIERGADPNAAERGTGLTPLHKAVIDLWLEAVDALLKPGLDTKLLPDFAGRTALDYARDPEVFELLRDFLARTHPVITAAYPVTFVFGLVVDDGAWRLISEGGSRGLRMLVPPEVTQAVAEARLEANMVDKAGIRRALSRAGLIVLEECVRVQRRFLGAEADIQQYTFLRIGAPLYRLQQEAMKMRLQLKRTDFDRTEDFFVDQANYPSTGFVDFSLAEVQKLVLNIIQAEPEPRSVAPSLVAAFEGNSAARAHDKAAEAAAALAVLAAADGSPPSVSDALAAKLASGGLLEPPTAGVHVARYMQAGVLCDFSVLHDPAQRSAVDAFWRTRGMRTLAYWRELVTDMFASDGRRGGFATLELVLRYFGHKMAFYSGFLAFLSNWLFSPAVAGVVVFGLEWIDRRVYVSTRPTKASYTKHYDQPLMFVYGFFICVWTSTIVQGWLIKQREIAGRWQVEDYQMKDATVNPRSTAPVRLAYANASWLYRATLTSRQRLQRSAFLLQASLPVTLFFAACIVGRMAVLVYLDYLILYTPWFYTGFATPLQDYSWTGLAAAYGHAALQALGCCIINEFYKAAVQWLVVRENWTSMELFEQQLATRVSLFMFLNNFSSLFYFCFWDRDVDKTAWMLAAMMITERALDYTLAYGLPYVTGRRPFRGAGGAMSAGMSDAQQLQQRALMSGLGDDTLGSHGPGAMSGGLGQPSGYPGSASSRSLGGGQAGLLSGKGSQSGKALGGVLSRTSSLRGVARPGSYLAAEAGGGAPLGTEAAPGDVVETPGYAHDEIRMSATNSALKFAELLVLFAYVALFSAAWPLAPLAAFVGTFLEVRLDLWKACNLIRRPLAERTRGIGRYWMGVFEGVAVVGVMTHCFMLGMSTDTFSDYFFPGITDASRLIASFSATYFFVLVYFGVRLSAAVRTPRWLAVLKQEQLRNVRDAHRVGWMLRERRYEMMLVEPGITAADVCYAEDMDEQSAERYLRVCRYLADVPVPERKRLLLDNVTTIPGLLQAIVIRARAGQWTDAGEKPTAAGLARQLVPDSDLGRCYMMGRTLREAIYAAYEQWRVDGAEDAAGGSADAGGVRGATHMAMSLRQVGCITCDTTMSQADRCLRLVRYVASLGGNPWEAVAALADRLGGGGLVEALRAAEDDGYDDAGEPLPEALSALVEPVRRASKAYEIADRVRRQLYDAWVKDPKMHHEELLLQAAEEHGTFPAQLTRYLLVKRYCDEMDVRKREEVLVLAKSTTLGLVRQIREAVKDGSWKDPGEPDFRSFVPPIVMLVDDDDEEGNINATLAAGWSKKSGAPLPPGARSRSFAAMKL